MSTLVIHYNSLETAAKKAEKLSEELEDYAEEVQSKVATKLSSYSGSSTGNIYDAKSFAKKKIDKLTYKAEAYKKYSDSISQFVTNAKKADTAVKNNISDLTGTFKSDNGIKDTIVTSIMNYITNELNETAIGRFFKDVNNAIVDYLSYGCEKIKDWYKYDGGKYVIKDVAFAVLAGVVAVAAIVAAVVTGGALIFVVAAVVAGVIGVLNAGSAVYNSIRAANSQKDGDPAWASYLSSKNTLTDTIRMDFDSKAAFYISYGIDAVEIVANVIGIVKSGMDVVNSVKKISTTYGSVTNFVRYQYTGLKQQGTLIKNTILGTGGTTTSLSGIMSSAMSSISDTASLYLHPSNWGLTKSNRGMLQGYSMGMESMGFKDSSKIYNWVTGADRSFTNTALAIKGLNTFASKITSFDTVYDFIGISDPYSGADISVGSVKSIVDKSIKNYNRTKDIITTMKGID